MNLILTVFESKDSVHTSEKHCAAIRKTSQLMLVRKMIGIGRENHTSFIITSENKMKGFLELGYVVNTVTTGRLKS
jgi:hypothetical protein